MTLVEKLVRCYSPSGSVTEVSQLLQDEMAHRGFDARIDTAGNIIGTIGSGPKKIYCVGHIDTVTGEIPVRVENGILHGRGSVDAKGSLAVFVEAAAQLQNSELLAITVVACPDEEAESRGALHLLETHQRADYVIIGEPSGWDAITLGYKGALPLAYHLEQPRHHMGADLPTPAECAIEFRNALKNALPHVGSSFDTLSINVREFNTSSDGLIERAEMAINIRTPVDFDLESFQECAHEHCGEAQLEWGAYTPAVLADKKNSLVRAFLSSIRAEQGEPKFKRKTGTSDMNLLAQWNCPILAYGPGDSKLDHTPSEHIRLDEYERAIAVLTAALKQL